MKIVSIYGGAASEAAVKDFNGAPVFGKLRIGSTGVFFPDGFKTRYLPYESFDRAYVMVHDATARMCCTTAGFEYFRMVFMKGEDCLGDYLSEDREAMQAALDCLRASAPGVTVGREQ